MTTRFAAMFADESTQYLSPPINFRALVGRAWLGLFGWRIEGAIPNVPRAVVIGAPHTSGWDLPFMLAICFALGIRVSWFGKHTLFLPPFGWVMRAVGGLPINRTARGGVVAAAIEQMRNSPSLMLAVAPEGTRQRTDQWKTGFYHIAEGAKVPLILGFLDYEKKCGGVAGVFFPTGDIDADIAKIRKVYAGIKGKRPNRFSE